MEWVVAIVIVAAVAAWFLQGWTPMRTRARTEDAAPRRPAMEGPWLGPTATIRLDVEVADPDAPSAQRLATTAAGKVLRSSPDVDEVVVEDRNGSEVARVPRHVPTPGPAPTRPEAETRPARSHGTWREREFVPGVDQDVAVGRRPLAERLDLPDGVRARVEDADDAVDVVRAILEAAGREAEVQGAMVRSGNDVVIIAADHSAGTASALSQAFLRFRESGARRGVVVHLGYVDPREVSRRRALAPACHHASAEVLQHMADAVALGGDPIEFALADTAV